MGKETSLTGMTDMHFKATLTAAILILCPIATLGQLPNGACSSQDAACEIRHDNLVGAVGDVSDPDDCRSACQDNSTSCKYFTYFGPQSFPFTNSCLFFSSCPILDEGSVSQSNI